MSERAATVVLLLLALVLPAGSLLQPWLYPSRSALPVIEARLNGPVILVTVPGLRADHVSHLGYGRQTTPVLDRVASEGVTFRRHYAASNLEAVTMGALQSGALPGPARWRDGLVIDPTRLTLPQRFNRAGFFAATVVANSNLTHRGLQRGFDATAWSPPDEGAAGVFQRALELVDQAPDGRLLLWVDLPDLLAPYGGAHLDPRRFAPEMPADFGATEEPYAFVGVEQQVERGWGSQERQWMVDRYDAALFAMDAALGAFLDELDRRMLLGSAVLCVMGTRGELIDDRPTLVASHGIDLHEHSLQTPLVIRMPALAERGRRVDALLNTLDVSATLLGLGLRFGAESVWEHGCGEALGTELAPVPYAERSVASVGPHGGRLPDGSYHEPRPTGALRTGDVVLLLDLANEFAPEAYKPRDPSWSLRKEPGLEEPLVLRARERAVDCLYP